MALPDYPITRNEQYLSRIAGEDHPIPDYPITRSEHYLAAIAGENVVVPDFPITREEQYLAYIAENGGGGGGGGGSAKHGVFFLDYDGSVVETWATDTVAAKTALPDNPTHTGLVAQGWNWDLWHIKDYIAAYKNADVYVGMMYVSERGQTEMDITLTKVTGLTVTCNMVGSKDWGDGTINNSGIHTYADYGDYTIICVGTRIPAGSSSAGGLFGSSGSNMNSYWCTAIRIGANVTGIGNYAFYGCSSLASITIPQRVTSIGSGAFSHCSSLRSITIPWDVPSIESNAFSYCTSLTSVAVPQGLTSIGSNTFVGCSSLASITIPQGLTSIGNSAFYGCSSLTSVAIPQRVTSINGSIFYFCYSLTSVAIPHGVTSIGSNTFNGCSSCTIYDFTSATSVPALSSTNVFYDINGICKIIVPDALYDTWIAATNWATYADYIYKASEVAA